MADVNIRFDFRRPADDGLKRQNLSRDDAINAVNKGGASWQNTKGDDVIRGPALDGRPLKITFIKRGDTLIIIKFVNEITAGG